VLEITNPPEKKGWSLRTGSSHGSDPLVFQRGGSKKSISRREMPRSGLCYKWFTGGRGGKSTCFPDRPFFFVNIASWSSVVPPEMRRRTLSRRITHRGGGNPGRSNSPGGVVTKKARILLNKENNLHEWEPHLLNSRQKSQRNRGRRRCRRAKNRQNLQGLSHKDAHGGGKP